MSKYATSFSMGFAAAVFLGATLLMVLRPAEASEPSLGDWVRMRADAKVAHARHVTAGDDVRARGLMFCLHELTAARADHARAHLGLGDAVHACKARLSTDG